MQLQMMRERQRFLGCFGDEKDADLDLELAPAGFRYFEGWFIYRCSPLTKLAHASQEMRRREYVLRVELGYVSCSLKVTRLIKYEISSWPPMTGYSASGAGSGEAADRTPTVQRCVWSPTRSSGLR